jgi:cysteine desulfurase
VAYLDAASAEPLHPAAREALLEGLEAGWADPARLHREGRLARMLLDGARERVAAMLGCRADEVSFTASGTQAAHLAVLGAARARRRAGRRIVASAVEHSAVLHAIDATADDGPHAGADGDPSDAGDPSDPGDPVTLVPVDRAGRVDPALFGAALRRDTALGCLQSANYEVGTLQPVEEVAAACRSASVPLFVDAAASAGRMPAPDGWSLLAASAHKWGGPAGVGVLAVRTGTRWRSPLPYDEREAHRVPGFPDVPAVLAATAALEATDAERLTAWSALRALTGRIRARVPELVPDTAVHGDPDRRLPHIVTFSCLYVNGEALVTELDRAGFSVSSGSACTADTLQPSHVLEAMGVLTHGNVRVSLPRGTTGDTIERFLEALPPIVAGLRASGSIGAASAAGMRDT